MREEPMEERLPRVVIVVAGCDGPPPPELLKGIEEFNAGAYFDCHETLEELWIGERGPLRTLYQGILQVAVGLLHLERGNYRGAVTLLGRGAERLRPFAPACRQVDVAALVADAGRLRAALEALGPERLGEVERRLIPRVRMVREGEGGARG